MQQPLRSQYINSDLDILGGAPVFKGTRVPISILFEYLQQSTVEEFLKGYPHVSLEMVNAVISIAAQSFSVEGLSKGSKKNTLLRMVGPEQILFL